METLATRLQYMMDKLNLKQRELADLAKVDQQYISSILRGESQHPRKLDQIAKVLNVSESWLQYGTQDKSEIINLSDVYHYVAQLDVLIETAIKIREELKNKLP